MMQYVEELRAVMGPTLRMDAEKKKAAREAIAADYLPRWGGNVEKNITREPFFGGASLNVVDLKLHMVVRWFNGGAVDHIPATIFDACPRLVRLHDAVRDHPGIRSWYARPHG
jgi:glutathione S-transferase